jgi:ceramide glucosyltransferase
VCPDAAGNPKVSKLIELAHRARHPLLLVNDSDILVGPKYLRHIASPLTNQEVGLVTCLYRVRARVFPARWEALGIATDFAPSTLVAPLAGVKEFALGSTLLFRAADLERIGGFSVIGDYVADDYQLAKRITGLGKRVHLAREVVDTGVQDSGWAGVWRHQVRWQRMIRVSRGDGYAGLPVTFATGWAVIALMCSQPLVAAGLVLLRMSVALVAGLGVLRCPQTARLWMLVPLRDMFGVAVWTAALFGRTVHWRGEQIELGKQGRIIFRSGQLAGSASTGGPIEGSSADMRSMG